MIKPVIDSRHELVYCTNCMYWDRLLKNIEDNSTNKIAPTPCCVCYPYNPEDGVKKLIRRKYYKKK